MIMRLANIWSTRFGRNHACSRHGRHGRQHGGALVEYTIVALCLVLILVAVPDDVIHKLMDAVKNAYASFTYALSISWF